jgi:septum formation protein
MTITVPFILASQSPRRRDLLDHIGVEFAIYASPAEEVVPPDMPPVEVVQELARQKATPVANTHPEALTLAADTIVVHDDTILGKPADADDARAMLRGLCNTTHAVRTGIALQHPTTDRRVTAVETTHVTFGSMTDAEIDAYVATRSPLDKAGAYGIQDHTAPLFIDGIDGDYYNVVGLPIRRLYRTLQTAFADILEPTGGSQR